MKNFQLAAIVLLMINLISCNSKNERANDNEFNEFEVELNRVKKELNNVGFLTDLSVKEKNQINLKIIFTKPYVSHPNLQLIFIEYLIYSLNEVKSLDNILITYYLDIEKNQNINEKKFNKNEIEAITKNFNNSDLYMELVIFCLNNFDEAVPYQMDTSIEAVSLKYKNYVLNSDFSNLLKRFASDIDVDFDDKYRIMSKATFTLYTIYELTSLREGNDHVKLRKLIDQLWKIKYKSPIVNSVTKDEINKYVLLNKNIGNGSE